MDQVRTALDAILGQQEAGLFTAEELQGLADSGYISESRLRTATRTNLEKITGLLPASIDAILAASTSQPSAVPTGLRTAQQQSTPTRSCVGLLIKGPIAELDASVLVDTGYTRDLLLPLRKAEQLGLKPDGRVVVATTAGEKEVMLRSYGAVLVSICVERPDGSLEHVNATHLDCWVMDATVDASSSAADTGVVAASTTAMDPSVFGDSNFTINEDVINPMNSSTLVQLGVGHLQGNVGRLSPIKSGKDSEGKDALLGRPGMLKLQLGVDKHTGDMVYSVSGPDAVL